jgi:hypothetical protein
MAELATSLRTPVEERTYRAAFRFLHRVRPDGSWEDTAAVKAYKQHQDAWLAAQQDYTSGKIHAELSNDPAVQQQWRQVDEPKLRERVVKAESDWQANGFRTTAEQARWNEAVLGAKSPVKTWSEWSKRFNPDWTA